MALITCTTARFTCPDQGRAARASEERRTARRPSWVVESHPSLCLRRTCPHLLPRRLLRRPACGHAHPPRGRPLPPLSRSPSPPGASLGISRPRFALPGKAPGSALVTQTLLRVLSALLSSPFDNSVWRLQGMAGPSRPEAAPSSRGWRPPARCPSLGTLPCVPVTPLLPRISGRTSLPCAPSYTCVLRDRGADGSGGSGRCGSTRAAQAECVWPLTPLEAQGAAPWG